MDTKSLLVKVIRLNLLGRPEIGPNKQPMKPCPLIVSSSQAASESCFSGRHESFSGWHENSYISSKKGMNIDNLTHDS